MIIFFSSQFFKLFFCFSLNHMLNLLIFIFILQLTCYTHYSLIFYTLSLEIIVIRIFNSQDIILFTINHIYYLNDYYYCINHSKLILHYSFITQYYLNYLIFSNIAYNIYAFIILAHRFEYDLLRFLYSFLKIYFFNF